MTRSARAIVALWLLLLALGFLIVSRASYTADFSAFLPEAPTAEQRLLVQQLKDGAVSRLVLVALEGDDATALAAQSRALAKTLRTDSAFITVANGEPVNRERDGALLMQYRYLLSPAVRPERFTATGLHAAIADSIDNLASPAGLALKHLLPRDPTGEMVALLELLDGGRQPHTVDGVWFSEDARRAMLLVQTRASGSDTDGQEAALTKIRTAFAATDNSASTHLLLTGPGVFSVAARAHIKRDVTFLSSLGFGATLIFLLVLYRSLRVLLLSLLPIVAGIVAGISAVALGFGEVHGITLGFGTTLIGEAVDYGIYLFTQAGAGGRTNANTANATVNGIAAWQRNFWPTIRLGVATSICGFAALLFSGFPGLSQLGLYSTAGLIAAALTTRFVLPALITDRVRWCNVAPLGRQVQRWIDCSRRLRWLPLALGVLALGYLLTTTQTVLNRDLAALSPVSVADQRRDAALRRDLRAPDVRYVVAVSAATEESALQGAEQIAPVLQTLIENNVIAGFENPALYLPSLRTQQQRRAALPASEVLRAQLAAALEGLPLQAAKLEPFIDDVENARALPPLTRTQLIDTSFASVANALLLPHEGGWTALLPLRGGVSGVEVAAVRAALANAAVPGAICLDMKAQTDQLYANYLTEALWLALGGALAIVLLVRINLGSMRATLQMLSPLVAAVGVIAAGLLLAGQALTLLHLIGLLLVVAIGSNYSLFFAKTPRTAHAAVDLPNHTTSDANMQAQVLGSLVIANFTTVAGFGVLAFASVPVLQALGIVVAPGAVLALCFAALAADGRSIDKGMDGAVEVVTD